MAKEVFATAGAVVAGIIAAIFAMYLSVLAGVQVHAGIVLAICGGAAYGLANLMGGRPLAAGLLSPAGLIGLAMWLGHIIAASK